MGTVYRKTATKSMPAGADITTRKGERFARWKDRKGRTRTAPLTTGRDGSDRIVVAARTYTAKYRDGQGVVREVPTGCRDETAARSVLADLQRRAELVKGRVLTAAEDAIADHQDTPLAEHVAAFIDHQKAKGVSRRLNDTLSQLRRVAGDCGFRRLADLDASRLERWLVARKAERMSAATRNEYRGAWVTFANWCVRTGRLLGNPFAGVPKADAKADRRRQRRALTEHELVRLLDVARRRPLLDRMTVRRGPRKGEACARLRPQTRAKLERLGRERALIYKTLVLTGLRKGELASLTVSQLYLAADPPFLMLDPADEKNREGSTIPLRSDLAADLREWLATKCAAFQKAAGEADTVRFDSQDLQPEECVTRRSAGSEGQMCQQVTTVHGLPPDTPVFNVPAGLVRILDRDLRLAGIPKRDERGRTVDVHAMRTTFGTLLSKAEVAPRTAQAAMRHSTIDLTMNVYTDPRLLDVAGAVESLPALPLEDSQQRVTQTASATGTDDSTPSQFAPKFAPTADKSRPPGAIPVKMADIGEGSRRDGSRALTAYPVKRKDPLTTPGSGPSQWAMTDSNRRHPRCKRGALTN